MLSARRKLLLADDSPTVRKVVEMFFGDEGYEVVAVGGGEEALRELEAERPPDVLLADVLMPGPDGYQLCERVKHDSRLGQMPVVLLVGAFEPFNEAEARRVGADTVLTKPFQSIRDLVSKVGSLLGGESKHASEQATHEETRAGDERAEASATHDAPAHAEAHAEASAQGFADEPAQQFGVDASSPYADLGADDELIEAKPADAFAAGPVQEEPRRADEYAQTSHEAYAQASHEPEPFVAEDEQPHAEPPPEDFSGARFGAREYEHAGTNGHSSSAHAASPFMSSPNFPEENQMSTPPSFESHAASAATADDTLLDLGQIEPHSADVSAVAEDDDFILDLDDETPSHASVGAVALEDAHAQDASSLYVEEPPQPDAPSAFAEAAHGEQVESFSEPAVPFAASAHSFSEDASADSPSESEYTFGAHAAEPSSFEQAAHAAHEASGESASELVMQDGPQGFASYVEPQGTGAAPRGFVEPEVVPSDVPAPSTVAEEFTDGSVEGDLSKAPADMGAGVATEAAQSSGSHAEPSAAGYVVTEGHTRVEEPARAGELSPEQIDAIARRVVEMMSDKVVREIAWEVVPELAELLIKRKLEEGQK